MEQRWRTRLRLVTKVFAVSAALLFIVTTLLGRAANLSVTLLLAAVALVLVVAVIDGIHAINAKTRRPD